MTVTLYVEMTAFEDFSEFLAVTDPKDLPFFIASLQKYVSLERPTHASLTWVQVNLDKQEWGKVYNHLLD